MAVFQEHVELMYISRMGAAFDSRGVDIIWPALMSHSLRRLVEAGIGGLG